MKNVLIVVATLVGLGFAAAALAATGSGTGIGQVAANLSQTMGSVAKAASGVCYVGGVVSTGAGIMKFKAFKDNPAQVTIGAPITLIFIGAALMVLPSVIKATGQTLFGDTAQTAGPSGVSDFGLKKSGS